MTGEAGDPLSVLKELRSLPPEQRAPWLANRGSAEESLPALAAEAERQVVVDLGFALDATEALVSLADDLGAPALRIRTRRARAQALAYANRFDDALHCLSDAADMATSAGDAVEAARARLISLHPLARLGRYDDAIANGEAARTAFLAAGEPALAAKADINLGVTHRMRDDPASALVHFDRARPVLQADPLLLAQLESNRAEALLDLNNFSAAESAFLGARAGFDRAGAHRAAAIVEGNLADLMSRQGRPDRALEFFERAARRLGDIDAPGDAARLQAERAEVLATVGLLETAQAAYQRAIPVLLERGMAWEAARARAGLGGVLMRLGRQDDADAVLTQAADSFSALGHATGAARAQVMRALIAHARSDPGDARARLDAALPLVRDRPFEQAVALHVAATVSLGLDDTARASEEIERGLATARRLDAAPLLADLLHVRAGVRLRQSDPAAALADLQEAIQQVERVRGSLQADRLRASFHADRMKVYEDAFVTAARLPGGHGADAAFAIAERARSRTLLDILHGGMGLASPLQSAGTDPAEQELLRSLTGQRAHLNALYREFDAADFHRRPADALAGWQRRLHDCESRMADLETRLAATNRLAGVYGHPADAREVGRILAPGSVLLEYFLAGGRCWCLILRADHDVACRQLASLDDLRAPIEEFSFQIGRALARGLVVGDQQRRLLDAVDRPLDRLGELLLGPVSDLVQEAQRLLIVPHGFLHALPFHALRHTGEYLLRRTEVAYAPSASVVAHLLTRARPPRVPGGRALVVGVADEAAPVAGQEAQAVAATVAGSELLLGPQATLARVRAAAVGKTLLHVASHARFLPIDPLSSGIRVADGWITARDVYSMDLQGAVVTLSGCDTGRAGVGSGDEQMGLVRGFLVAGASALVMSLWPVHDQSTGELMASFYGRWYAQGDPLGSRLAAALRTSQLEMLEKRPHPAAWAPFVLLGCH